MQKFMLTSNGSATVTDQTPNRTEILRGLPERVSELASFLGWDTRKLQTYATLSRMLSRDNSEHIQSLRQPLSATPIAEAIVAGKSFDEVSNLFKHRMSALESDSITSNSLMHWAAIMGRDDLIDFMRQKSVNFNGVNIWGLKPIHMAIVFNQNEFVRKLAEKYGQETFSCPVNTLKSTIDNLDLTPLALAVMCGNAAAVKLLLAQPNTMLTITGFGHYLFWAVYCRQPKMLEVLLEHGNIEDLLNLENSAGLGLLEYAAALGELLSLHFVWRRYMLKSHEKQSILQNQGIKAMCRAAEFDQLESVQYLVVQGIDVNTAFDYKCMLSDTVFRSNYITQILEKLTVRNKDLRDLIVNALSDDLKGSRLKLPKPTENRIDNLVFKGGGVKGIAYVGALQAYERCMELRAKALGNDAMVQNTHGIKQVIRVAGASAGAITAMAVAMGMGHEEIKKVMRDMPLKLFLDGLNDEDIKKLASKDLSTRFEAFLRGFSPEASIPYTSLGLLEEVRKVLEKDSICSGKAFLNWLCDLVRNKLTSLMYDKSDENAKISEILTEIKLQCYEQNLGYLTLGDLAKLVMADSLLCRFKHLYVVASRLDTENNPQVIEKISSEDSKWTDVFVIDAVRASMSIPAVFAPYNLRAFRRLPEPDLQILKHKYADGGILKNYPVELFDRYQYFPDFALGNIEKTIQNPYTLGFCLVEGRSNQEDKKPEDRQLGWLKRKFKENFIDPIIKDIDASKGLALLKALVSYYLDAETLIADFEGTRVGRTIEINNCGVDLLAFDLGDNDKEALMKSGFESVANFFEMADKVKYNTASAGSVVAPMANSWKFGSPIYAGQFSASNNSNNNNNNSDNNNDNKTSYPKN